MEEYRRLCRWEDNMSLKMDLKEIDVDLVNLME